MANRSYLYCTDINRIYYEKHDPEHKVREGRWIIPLLWMPLFHPNDIQIIKESFMESEWEEKAPLTEKNIAISRLDNALLRICRIFKEFRFISEYVSTLKKDITDTPGKYVTVSMLEIIDNCVSYDLFHSVLEFFAFPDNPENDKTAFKLFCSFSGFDPAKELCDPKYVKDTYNYNCLIGFSYEMKRR